MSDGFRNDGAGGNKSCPGSNFFGGNKVVNCETNLLPLVNQAIAGHLPITVDTNLLRYAVVTAGSLNVRFGPGTNHPIVSKLSKEDPGFVLEEEAGWAKIGPKLH